MIPYTVEELMLMHWAIRWANTTADETINDVDVPRLLTKIEIDIKRSQSRELQNRKAK